MSQYTDFLTELFEPFGTVTARKMFGAHGLFHDGLMIGLVANDVLYLKADAELAPRFTARGLPAFTYEKSGKTTNLSFFQAPEEILDDPQLASSWARDAYQAALRSRRPSSSKTRSKHKPTN